MTDPEVGVGDPNVDVGDPKVGIPWVLDTPELGLWDGRPQSWGVWGGGPQHWGWRPQRWGMLREWGGLWGLLGEDPHLGPSGPLPPPSSILPVGVYWGAGGSPR